MGISLNLPNSKDPFHLLGGSSNATKKTIDKNIRNRVWTIYNGNSLSGICYCCNDPIVYSSFHVGHNKPKSKEGTDNLSNLRPICSSCNLGMGNRYSIEQYKAKYFSKGKETKKTVKKLKKKKSKKRLSFMEQSLKDRGLFV